jgi:hypothetical protein
MSGYLERIITSAAQPVAVSRRRADSMPPQIADPSLGQVEDLVVEPGREFETGHEPAQNPLAGLPGPNTAMEASRQNIVSLPPLWSQEMPSAAISSTQASGAERLHKPEPDRLPVGDARQGSKQTISGLRTEADSRLADLRIQPLKPHASGKMRRAGAAPQGLLANAGIRVAPPVQAHTLSWQIRALQRHLGPDDNLRLNAVKSATTEPHTPLIDCTAESENPPKGTCSDPNAGVVKEPATGGPSPSSPRYEQRPLWALVPPAQGLPPNAPAFSGPELVIKNLEVRVVPPTPKPSPPSPAAEPRVERGRLGAWASPARYYLRRD